MGEVGQPAYLIKSTAYSSTIFNEDISRDHKLNITSSSTKSYDHLNLYMWSIQINNIILISY